MSITEDIVYLRFRKDILNQYLSIAVPQLTHIEWQMAVWDFYNPILSANQLVDRIHYGQRLADMKKDTAEIAAHARAISVYLEIYG